MANAKSVFHRGLQGEFKGQIPVKVEFEFFADVALWYGATTQPAPCQKANLLLKRLFGVLYYGGIQFMTERGVWHDWAQSSPALPVAAALSHGARVLIQLPSSPKNTSEPKPENTVLSAGKAEKAVKATINAFADETGDYSFWSWLNADQSAQQRTVSTHGLKLAEKPTLTAGEHNLYLEEIKTESKFQSLTSSNTLNAHHYALNVPLGGYKMPSAIGAGLTVEGDGCDGHLYFLFLPPGPYSCGGLLVGCENAQFGTAGNRHTAAGHSTSGMPNPCSATGGLKWGALSYVLNPCPRGDCGDIFVDLIGHLNDVKNRAEGFDPNNLDDAPFQAGNPGQFSILMTTQNWQRLTASVPHANRSVQLLTIDTFLSGLNTQYPTKTQLKQIIQACKDWNEKKRNFSLAEQDLVRQVFTLHDMAINAKKSLK